LVKDAGAEAVISKAIGEKRYTLAPMYVPNTLDAHGEWTDPDELQNAVWNYVRSGDRRIRLQHNRDIVAGEWVEVMQIPYPMNVPMYKGDGSIEERTYPAGTVFLGVIWEPWAWEAVKNGTLSGYSIGGRTERVLEEMPMDKAQSRDRLGRFSSTGGGGAASAPAGGGGAAGGGAKMTAAQEKSMNAATDTVISSYSSARTSGSVDVQEKMRSAVDTHNKAVESLKAGDKAAASKHSLSTMKLMMSAAASPMLTSTNRVTMESSAQRYSELMTRAIG
jgi:hypothetical protein